MKAAFISVGTVVSICLLAMGCAQQSAESVQPRATFGQLRAQLDVHLEGCTRSVGVDPREPQDVGEYELVPIEQAWLDCAYEGIERIMVPGSHVPEMYRRLIAESRALTNLVERGEVTREQRRIRIETLVAEIEDAEFAILVASQLELSEEQRRANEEHLRSAFEEVRMLALPRRRR